MALHQGASAGTGQLVSSHREAAQLICDRGDELRVISAMYPAQPDSLLREIVAEASARGAKLTILCADLSGRLGFVSDEMVEQGRLKIVTIGGRISRRLRGKTDCVPTSLWEIARRLSTGEIPVDVVVASVSPETPDGHYSLGPMVSYAPAALEAADFVVVDVNAAVSPMPGYPGPAASEVDLVVDAGSNEIRYFDPPPMTEQQARIGANVASLVPDGATLQLGIGGIPEGLLRALGDKKDLGIHSGAIPETAIELIESGVINGARKAVDRGIHVTTSLLGTERLYRYAADPKHGIELHPVTRTHDPAALAAQSRFWAINSAFEVDLSGQVNAEIIGGSRAASGGGQVDFGKWAHSSRDGANVMALPARSPNGAPRIVAELGHPHVVTTHRNDVDFIVTEFGVADLRGKTMDERAELIAGVAHPDDREGLLANL